MIENNYRIKCQNEKKEKVKEVRGGEEEGPI